MTKISVEIFDDVVTVLNKIRDINDRGIEIEIPEGSILFDNILNLKLIKKECEKYGFTVDFETTDEIGLQMLEMLEENGAVRASNEYLEDNTIKMAALSSKKKKLGFGFGFNFDFLKNFTLPTLNISAPKFTGISWPIALGIVIPIALFGFIYFQTTQQKVTTKIIVNSQPLARSITMKVKAGAVSDADKKILNGIKVNSTAEASKDAETSGTKTIGNKATGTVTIGNNTSDKITLKKGIVLNNTHDSKKYNFVTKEEVEVPAAALSDPANPLSNKVQGKIDANVEAELIGPDYNIDKDETLSIKGYDKDDLIAVAKEDFSGGKLETVKIVSELDAKNLSAALAKDITEQAETSFKSKLGAGQKLITGSVKTTLVKETFTKKVGDEAKSFSDTQMVQTEGLTYMSSDLNRLVDSLVKDYIPEGFILSDKEKTVSVDILGNSTNSVLNSDEADIQVTLKAYVVPDISEDQVKKDLIGKTPKEAESYLSGIRNIKSYEFNMHKSIIPFLNKVPKDTNKIEVTIERQ